jgi:Intracellular proteinase inhibitor
MFSPRLRASAVRSYTATDRMLPELLVEIPPLVRQGDLVPITLHVTHPGPDALELYLLGRAATFDVEVADANGRVAWRRLEGAVLQQVVQLRVLWPGERFDLHASWDQRDAAGATVPAGDYRVRARLLTDALEPAWTAPVALRVA